MILNFKVVNCLEILIGKPTFHINLKQRLPENVVWDKLLKCKEKGYSIVCMPETQEDKIKNKENKSICKIMLILYSMQQIMKNFD